MGKTVSRTPAKVTMTVVRGSTWEDDITYLDSEGTPVVLTSYRARLQVRTRDEGYGTTTTSSLLLTLDTTATPDFFYKHPTDVGKLVIAVPPADHAALNPSNEESVDYLFGIELYIPAGVDPEYVVPLCVGRLSVRGEVVR